MLTLAVRIKWQPVTFSFTSLSRSSRQANDPLQAHRMRLEPLDIKCITEYLTQHTTHVISKKRNTAAVLQALVNGRHIVTDQYVDAVEGVGQPTVTQTGEQQFKISLLEQDFDADWPEEVEYLPPPGNEPNPLPPRSVEYSPKSERSEMFSRYTFVFCDQAQYDNLLPVVTGGGGKALVRDVTQDQADVGDMVDYVKEVAGKKGVGAFKLSQQPNKGGVIVVRPSDKVQAGMPGFFSKLDQALDQKSMEQNEFLEAILKIKPEMLKQPLDPTDVEMEDTGPQQSPPRRESSAKHAADVLPSQPSRELSVPQEERADRPRDEPSQPSATSQKRKPRRIITQSRFKGFDDFDPSQISKYRSPTPPEDLEEPSQAPSYNEVMDVESQYQAPATQRSQPPSRKRPAASAIEKPQETVGDVMDGMLKGAAAMKRRRIAEGKEPASNSFQANEEPIQSTVTKPKRKKEKEIDVRAVVAERRAAEEEARQRDEENLREALEGMDVSDIRNLAQIEEMEVVRRPPPSRRDGSHDSRWDDRWNGRKNFKKFRRAGRPGAEGVQRQRVIVGLEEVKRKNFGIGEEYWLEPVSETRRKEKERREVSQSQHLSQAASLPTPGSAPRRSANGRSQPTAQTVDDEEDASRFQRRIRNSVVEDLRREDAEEILPEEIAGPARDEDLEAIRRGTQNSTQTLRATGTQRKRPAAEPAGGAAKKRQRLPAAAPVEVEDSDDDDALKFRRRRR